MKRTGYFFSIKIFGYKIVLTIKKATQKRKTVATAKQKKEIPPPGTPLPM